MSTILMKVGVGWPQPSTVSSRPTFMRTGKASKPIVTVQSTKPASPHWQHRSGSPLHQQRMDLVVDGPRVGAVVGCRLERAQLPRCANRKPGGRGTPRPFKPLFGFDHWIPILQIFTLIAVVGLSSPPCGAGAVTGRTRTS